MAKANVFNMAGQQVGEIELSEAVFGIERPSGFHPGSPVDSRRYRVCSQAPRLQLHPE